MLWNLIEIKRGSPVGSRPSPTLLKPLVQKISGDAFADFHVATLFLFEAPLTTFSIVRLGLAPPVFAADDAFPVPAFLWGLLLEPPLFICSPFDWTKVCSIGGT